MSLVGAVRSPCALRLLRRKPQSLSAITSTTATTIARWNSLDCHSSELVYKGPLSDLALKLKVVSVSTAALGVVGLPILLYLYTGDIPGMGQYAVAGSGILGATGSTIAVDFVFSPYIHRLERVPVRKCHAKTETPDETATKPAQKYLLKAITRNILAMRVETVFDPATDVEPYKGIRPFCNFTAKGRPLFLHPELLNDIELRKQLIGEEPKEDPSLEAKLRKSDEDELF